MKKCKGDVQMGKQKYSFDSKIHIYRATKRWNRANVLTTRQSDELLA